MNKKYRKLTEDEKLRLQKQSCEAEDWNEVNVV